MYSIGEDTKILSLTVSSIEWIVQAAFKKIKKYKNNKITSTAAIRAFFLGALYLAIYLIYLSYVCEGNIKIMLLGES